MYIKLCNFPNLLIPPESDEQRPPIQVRGSPRRRPRVIRNKSTAKEHRKSGIAKINPWFCFEIS